MAVRHHRIRERDDRDDLACNDNRVAWRFDRLPLHPRPARRSSVLGILRVAAHASTRGTRMDYLAPGVLKLCPA